MALRTHEIHPSLVHVPLTLAPATVVLDAIGALTGSTALTEAARRLAPFAAASAALAGVFGYVAQGAVNAQGQAHELLATHRNLNTALVGATAVLAAWRFRHERPSGWYLLAGLGGLLAMGYTAYLGGQMVYSHRVGVEPEGVRIEESPELRAGSFTDAARRSARQVVQEVERSASQIASGEWAPAISKRAHARAHQPRS